MFFFQDDYARNFYRIAESCLRNRKKMKIWVIVTLVTACKKISAAKPWIHSYRHVDSTWIGTNWENNTEEWKFAESLYAFTCLFHKNMNIRFLYITITGKGDKNAYNNAAMKIIINPIYVLCDEVNIQKL